MHVVPSSKQGAFSAEAYVPFERFDVRGEVVYVNENRREAPDADKTMTLRRGKFSGVGGYGQMSVWLLGTPRINGNPAGNYGVLKVPSDLGAQAPYALQLVARGEVMRLNYDANSRSGADAGGLSGSTTDIKVNAYQLGLNYWATVYLSDTDGRISGTAGTKAVTVGYVAPANGQLLGSSPDKVLYVDLTLAAAIT